jgi:beta-N-acetylhexosaminidase
VSDAERELFVSLCAETFGGAILISHGIVRAWDERWPVSVSTPAIAALRAALPEALLVTDDIQMKGLQAVCTTEAASLRALSAGVDLLCIGNNLLVQQDECFRVAAQLRGELSADPALAARLASSRDRIARRKALVAAEWNDGLRPLA